MTQLAFRYQNRPYRAEVILGPDLQLDEILAVEYETASGSVITVDDPVELEPVIEREVATRTEELRKHRDALRSRPPSRCRPLSGDDQRWDMQKDIAPDTPSTVECPHSVRDTPVQPINQEASMTLTFHSIKGTRALYSAEGIRGYIRFPVKAFDGTPNASMTLDGITLKPAKVVKERKPKAPLTAEKIAKQLAATKKREERLLKAQADLGL
jgi:hypothetical protein